MLLKINGRTDELCGYEAGDSQIFGKTRGDEKKFRGSSTCPDSQKGRQN